METFLAEEVDSKVERKVDGRQTVMRTMARRIGWKRFVRNDREMQKNGREA